MPKIDVHPVSLEAGRKSRELRVDSETKLEYEKFRSRCLTSMS